MGTAHPRRHGETSGQVRFLTGHQGRRTDDRFRRSAPFCHLERRRRGQPERLVPHVLQVKARLDELVVADSSEVNQFLIHGQSRSHTMRRRLTGRAILQDRHPEGHTGQNGHTDCARNPQRRNFASGTPFASRPIAPSLPFIATIQDDTRTLAGERVPVNRPETVTLPRGLDTGI